MSTCDAPGGSIIAIGSPGAMRMTTKTMTATPKSVISVVTLRVRIPRSAVMGSPGQAQLSSPGRRSGDPEDPEKCHAATNLGPRLSLRSAEDDAFELSLRCQPAGFIR